MANLGTAQTRNFQIGNAELRIGRLSDAGRLTQKGHSVGLLQSANVNFAQNVAELKGGLPLQLVDSVITETTVTVSAQAYEYTRRNIRAMLNEGVKAAGSETDYSFTATLSDTGPAAGATDSLEGLYGADFVVNPTNGTLSAQITLSALAAIPGGTLPGSNGAVTLPVGTLLGVYKKGAPENLSIIRLTSEVTSYTSGNMVLNFNTTETPMLFDLANGTELVVYTINPVGLGNSAETQYYTIDLLGKNHSSGLVQGFRFWKASIQGGMDFSFSNDSFGVTPLSFKVLLPTEEDLNDSNLLGNIKTIQAAGNPLGMFWTGQAK